VVLSLEVGQVVAEGQVPVVGKGAPRPVGQVGLAGALVVAEQQVGEAGAVGGVQQ